MKIGSLMLCLLMVFACTEAPKDPRVDGGSTTDGAQDQATESGTLTSEQVLEALAKMDKSTVKVSGTAGGVRIETDGTNTKTIPAKNITVDGTGITKTISAKGEHVVVDGDSNTLTVKGHVGLLVVNGNKHKVYVQSVEQVEVNASGSNVYWAERTNGKEPRILGKDASSTVQQKALPQ